MNHSMLRVKSLPVFSSKQRSTVLSSCPPWTGSALHTGWYVGFIEVADETRFFALNLKMDSAEQAPLRKQLALLALDALGII